MDSEIDLKQEYHVPSYSDLFFTFFGISMFTIGGGYVMVPVMARAVEKKKWMSSLSFLSITALSQSLPGPIAFSTALITGHRLRGWTGGLLAALGVLIPPFIVIAAAAAILDRLKDNILVRGFLNGCYAAVIGLVAAFAWKMVRSQKWDPGKIAIILVGIPAAVFLHEWVFFLFAGLTALLYLKEHPDA